METKKCPNCNNDIPADATVCPLCGKSLAENTDVKKESDGNMKKSLIAAALAVIGIIIMLAFRAWLGVPIYLIGFFIAVKSLKEGNEAVGGEFVDYLKESLKGKDLSAKINTIVVAIAPIVLVVGVFFYIYVDSARQVEAIYNSIDF